MNPRPVPAKPLLITLTLALALALVMSGAACSIGNISRADCTSNAECLDAFGPGATCVSGFCSTPISGSCKGQDAMGRPCLAAACPPKNPADFPLACTDATCASFDNKKRLTKLTPDGGLPDLP